MSSIKIDYRYLWSSFAWRLETYLGVCMSLFIDSLFFLLWIVLNIYVDKITAPLNLSNRALIFVDSYKLFQLVFAISTLAPVVWFIIVDVAVGIKRIDLRGQLLKRELDIQYRTKLAELQLAEKRREESSPQEQAGIGPDVTEE